MISIDCKITNFPYTCLFTLQKMTINISWHMSNRPEPIMLKILPIILSRILQNFHPLFLSVYPIIPNNSQEDTLVEIQVLE